MKAPLAKKISGKKVIHGVEIKDDFAWMKDKGNPEVIAYLEAENAYTKSQMGHTKDLQKELYDEILGRIKEDDQSVPYQVGTYWYYTRTEAGKEYAIHCRKKESLKAEEEILIDENELAKGHDFFDLGDLEISPDEQLMAYTVDTDGSEKYALFVQNLSTGALNQEQVKDIYPEIEWANDNRTIFYSILEEQTHRAYQLYRFQIGSQEAGTLVFEEPDDAFSISFYKTKDEKYFFLYVESHVTSEMHFFSADEPEAVPQLFQERKHGVEFGVEHHKGYFYVYTNEDALNFRLLRSSLDQPGREHWEEVIPHDIQVKIDNMDVFEDFLVVYLRKQGQKSIQVRPFGDAEPYEISFEEAVYTVGHGTNLEFSSKVLRFKYTSLTTPASVYDFDMGSRERELRKRQVVLGGYEPSEYQSERIFATAADGTQVPISLVYRKDLRKEGPQPLYLYAYGSYGVSVEPGFNSSRLSLIDRGVIFAMAHIRGGGSQGRAWYEAGKLLHKKNTFSDFIACAEHVNAEGYTDATQLCIAGGSAGGMLMGAVINMRPDLFRVVQAFVPFVDVMNTMLDPTLPLTVPEYDEWGNPQEKESFDYMIDYSPYDNVEAKHYPEMLVTAGLNDPRVHYWEPAKWTAKLRQMKLDNNLLLLKTNMGAGHQGASGRYGHIKEVAFNYAFLLDRLGIEA